MLKTVLILFLAASLAACGSSPDSWQAPLQQPFVLTADVEGSFSGSVRFCYTTAESWSLEYLAPHAAAGLTVTKEAGRLTLAQGALKSSISADVLPQQSVFRVLCDAVTLCACAVPQQQENGVLLYSDSRLSVAVQNGVVQQIADHAGGTVCRITGFMLQNAPSD